MTPIPVQLPRHAALEALADGFCIADAAQRITYWNAAAERLFGVDRGEAVGRTLTAVLPGAADPEFRERLARVAEHGALLRMTVLADSELFARHLSVHASPMEDGSVALQFRDATGEQRLADQYAQLLQSIRDGFIAVDREWRIVYVNRAAEVLVSLRRDRAVGNSLWGLLPDDPPYLADALRGTMRDREPRHLVALRPAGRIFRNHAFDVWTHALPDGGISILFEDVTERLENEVELARLAAEAEEASRAKSRFFAAVSHELRTPLNAIVGYTYLLASGMYDGVPPDAVRASERAHLCAEHLSHLVDDVIALTVSDIDRLRLVRAPARVEEIFAAALGHLRQQAEAKGLAFREHVAEGLPAVRTDADRARQVLTALVSNAVKFTSAGAVDVSAARSADGAWMEIRVRDTGPGVPVEERERIFEAFEQLGAEARTDSLRRGTGLGLTLARQLAGVLGGDVTMGGEEGQGAEFLFRLPMNGGSARE